MSSSLPPLRIYGALLLFLGAACWSFTLAVWLLAALAFCALREYLSLADLRPEDRWAMLSAYLSIPFVAWLVQTDWYGMFVVSIPVYVFIVVPFLVVLGGGGARGTVFSVGTIDFGLFLFVYCLGHLAYLTRFAPWMGLLVVLAAGVTDVIDRRLSRAGVRPVLRFAAAAPPVVGLALLLCARAAIPQHHAIALGLMLPVLVLAANFTLLAVEEDLGIDREELEPGRGRMVDGLRALLFAAPVAFHYLHYFDELV